MTSTTAPPASPGTAAHGGTALDARHEPARHRMGGVLHAIRVYAVTAVEVVVLGSSDSRRV